MELRYWKCGTCGSKSHHKGLCRDCTEYDEVGVILNAIQRERVNKNGTPFQKTIRKELPVLSEREGFRKARKLTKKEVRKMKENMQRFKPTGDEEILIIGESEDEE